MLKVDKHMIIGELIRLDENIIPILMREGMHCIGCPSSQMETLEEAAYVHGMDPDVLVARLNTIQCRRHSILSIYSKLRLTTGTHNCSPTFRWLNYGYI